MTLATELTEWFDNLDFDRSSETTRIAEHAELMRIVACGVAQAPSEEETFCHWLKGYLGAIKGRDELDAREANVVRNKLNEMLDGTSPMPSTHHGDAA